LYTPKISEDLIPLIYQKAKSEKKPMTKIVNEILEEKLSEDVRDQDNDDYNESATNSKDQT
jgi:hypothetical protein